VSVTQFLEYLHEHPATRVLAESLSFVAVHRGVLDAGIARAPEVQRVAT
jgi:hypothetical protein